MRFLKVLLPVLVFGILALAPHPAFAAEATFFGPIIPPQCHCDAAQLGAGKQSAPDFKCVLATMQNVVNFAISIGVIIFVLVCAYAGFLFMFSSINAENKSKAKNILTNAVVGLLLALAAWLLVDFIMKTLYNEKWGPWNSILGNAGNMCLTTTTPPAATGTGDGVTTVTPPDTDITGGFEVGMHVECNKGGQGTYLPAVVNGISEDTGGGNPRVSVCYDGQTRANGGCEDLIPADRCRIPSGSPGAGIPANGSVTQAGGSCAGNTRACGPNLRCGLQADGANKDKCIATTQTPANGGPFTLSGIDSRQRNDAAPQLASLLSCMASKPGTSGARITSISDDALYNGKTWAQCRAGGCAHTSNSWHYGGANGQDKSLAVDFGNNSNSSTLRSALETAACQCNSSVRILQEGGGPIGSALHISFGASEGRGCN